MALVTKEFKLDLAPGQLRPVVNASQGDIGRPFKADLYWNGSPWTATGYTAKLRGKKPDNTVFEYTATVSGSSVTFSTTEQMTIISGPVECELVFTQGDDVIASANFVLMVEDSPYNPDAPSESVVPGIEDLIEQSTPQSLLLLLSTKRLLSLKAYVTPEMFGAVGDGTTDDTAALRQALSENRPVYLKNKTYYLADTVTIPNGGHIFGGSFRFKSVSGVVKKGFDCYLNCIFENVKIYSVRDQSTVTFSDSVQTSNIIGVSVSNGGKVRMSNAILQDLEYGVKCDTDDTAEIELFNVDILSSLMPIYASNQNITCRDCVFDCVATNTLYHPAYIKPQTIKHHVWSNCKFLSSTCSAQYYNGDNTITGTAYIYNCFFEKHYIDHQNNTIVFDSVILGAVNYGGTFYNCQIASVLTAAINVTKKVYNSTINRYVMSTNNGSVALLSNCSIYFDDLGQSPVQITGGEVNFYNCVISAAYSGNTIRLSGSCTLALIGNTIERLTATNSRIVYTASGTPSTTIVGNLAHANDTNFPTTSGNVVVSV